MIDEKSVLQAYMKQIDSMSLLEWEQENAWMLVGYVVGTTDLAKYLLESIEKENRNV